MIFRGIREIGDVMDENLQLDDIPAALEAGSGTAVLFEGVHFVHEEQSAWF